MQMTASTNKSCILVAAILSLKALAHPLGDSAKCVVGELSYHVVFCLVRLHSEQTLYLFLSIYQTQQIKRKILRTDLRETR